MSNSPDIAPQLKRGPIGWMTTNSVAANLLMVILMAGGLLFSTTVTQEVFPAFDLDEVVIRVPYPGASPAEVEQGILLSIEDQVAGVEGAKEVTSQALEGVGIVRVELLTGVDTGRALQDIKNEVDRIITFPDEAEEPVVSLSSRQRPVLSVVVHGDAQESSLRAYVERLREDLIAAEDITLVELQSSRAVEIAVEVPEEELRRYGLTLPGIARRISEASLELPAGEVRTRGGKVLLRTQERRDLASEFAELPVVTTADGAVVYLGDIAEVVDGLDEADTESSFDGNPALALTVYRVGKESPISVSSAALEVLDEARLSLPAEIQIEVWDDQSETYRARIDLLSRNALLGLGLVLLLLGLFLEPRIAFWVTMGILISVVGSFLVLPSFDVSINLVSLFAFIVTLGIIVDDAIIVGENVFEMRARGVPPMEAAVRGVKEISGPVTFAVLTNIIAFLPLLFVPGPMGKIFRQIPAVVISVFAISLIESLFILPAHLAHVREPGRISRALALPSRYVTRAFDAASANLFAPVLGFALRNRYLVPAIALAALAISVGFVGGGFLKVGFLPRIDSDIVKASVRLPVGSPIEDTRAVRERVVAAVEGAQRKAGEGDIVKGIYARIGGTEGGVSNELAVDVALISPEQRAIGGIEFSKLWRAAVGDVPGLEAMTFNARTGPGGSAKPIDVELSAPDRTVLETAARELRTRLERYDGVADLDDGTAAGKRQWSFQLEPEARALGLTSTEVAAQVRAAFFGAEAQRQQRGRNEVKVMVRRPREEREMLGTVEELMLRTPSGGDVPLAVAARVEEGRSYTSIDRRAGRRVVSVTADVDDEIADANSILADLREQDLPEMLASYDGLTYSLEGEQADQRESLSALGMGMVLALFAIFAMLAIPLGSYTQPMIVLSGAPFGVIGALLGHLALGYNLSLMSMFGIIALTGVVVNDSLVLVVTANRHADDGLTAFEAIRRAAVRRLRPILLTSLTTSLGLLPMMLETSTQARFLVPMAISLGFGVLFSTFVILLLVPALFLVREDLIALWRKSFGSVEPDGLGAGQLTG